MDWWQQTIRVGVRNVWAWAVTLNGPVPPTDSYRRGAGRCVDGRDLAGQYDFAGPVGEMVVGAHRWTPMWM